MKRSLLVMLLVTPYLYGGDTNTATEKQQRLDINGEPLQYTEVEVINKAPFPITISWRELSNANKQKLDMLNKEQRSIEEKLNAISYLPFIEQQKAKQGTEWKEGIQINRQLKQDIAQQKEEAIMIEHMISPNSSKILQLGEKGLFDMQDNELRPKIQYRPSSYNEEYVISLPINLYQTYPIVITAESWADMLKHIYTLDIIYSESDNVKKLERFVLPQVGHGGSNGHAGIFKHKTDVVNISPYY